MKEFNIQEIKFFYGYTSDFNHFASGKELVRKKILKAKITTNSLLLNYYFQLKFFEFLKNYKKNYLNQQKIRKAFINFLKKHKGEVHKTIQRIQKENFLLHIKLEKMKSIGAFQAFSFQENHYVFYSNKRYISDAIKKEMERCILEQNWCKNIFKTIYVHYYIVSDEFEMDYMKISKNIKKTIRESNGILIFLNKKGIYNAKKI